MTTRTVGAERFDTHGRRVESVDVSVNALSPNVYLHIEGQKRTQQFRLTEASWLEIARLQLGEKRYAACWDHAGEAIRYFPEGTVHIRQEDGFGTCVCGKPANLFFMEVKGKLDQPEMPPGSFERAHPNG